MLPDREFSELRAVDEIHALCPEWLVISFAKGGMREPDSPAIIGGSIVVCTA